MKLTLTEIKHETTELRKFYDDEYGFLNKYGVSGQLGWDAIRVMHPVTGRFATWVVSVDLENAGIDGCYTYSDQDAGRKPTSCWRTAVARAVKLACEAHNINLIVG